ncbi:hypothetical protein E2C01_089863 [Portunus trituberculatus]|uniref:Uncharacterized protein n=1 Tax=Portunus trituberculatus TaxID=210409 RepID=A0A5B7JQS2_PORTR|nr:hypothetical protein [Portunus trituberculatus]
MEQVELEGKEEWSGRGEEYRGKIFVALVAGRDAPLPCHLVALFLLYVALLECRRCATEGQSTVAANWSLQQPHPSSTVLSTTSLLN